MTFPTTRTPEAQDGHPTTLGDSVPSVTVYFRAGPGYAYDPADDGSRITHTFAHNADLTQEGTNTPTPPPRRTNQLFPRGS